MDLYMAENSYLTGFFKYGVVYIKHTTPYFRLFTT